MISSYCQRSAHLMFRLLVPSVCVSKLISGTCPLATCPGQGAAATILLRMISTWWCTLHRTACRRLCGATNTCDCITSSRHVSSGTPIPTSARWRIATRNPLVLLVSKAPAGPSLAATMTAMPAAEATEAGTAERSPCWLGCTFARRKLKRRLMTLHPLFVPSFQPSILPRPSPPHVSLALSLKLTSTITTYQRATNHTPARRVLIVFLVFSNHTCPGLHGTTWSEVRSMNPADALPSALLVLITITNILSNIHQPPTRAPLPLTDSPASQGS